MSEKRSTEADWDRPHPGHVLFCEKHPEGPVFRLAERLTKVETRVDTIETERAGEKGAIESTAKRTVRAVQIAALIASAFTVINFVLSHWPHK